jgi:serine/threonine-protein kinase
MEYLTGIDLHRLVDEYGPLPPARAIHLIRQACLSLAEAHQAGLVHRDIKPSNLLTCNLGGVRDILKVLDFGVVRLTKGQDHFVTATGQITGTPACMAPELIDGSPANATADIYGLGCVAYRLLTGRNVFAAPTVMALMMQHATTAPDPPSKHNPLVPPELDEVILQCLKKNPLERMDSVVMLRERLAAVPLANPWNEQDAAAWWDENIPAASEVEVAAGAITVSRIATSETVRAAADASRDTNSDHSNQRHENA